MYDNRAEREKFVNTRNSPTLYCLKCGRTLTSKFIVCCDDEGRHDCVCGYSNHLTYVGGYWWRMTLVKMKPKPKGSRRAGK